MNILNLIYCSGQTDAELKNVLQTFEAKGRYDYWTEQVAFSLPTEGHYPRSFSSWELLSSYIATGFFFVIKLHQACWLHRVVSSLVVSLTCIMPDLQVVEATCIMHVDKKSGESIGTKPIHNFCSRLVINEPEQAMRTHPDIGLISATR